MWAQLCDMPALHAFWRGRVLFPDEREDAGRRKEGQRRPRGWLRQAATPWSEMVLVIPIAPEIPVSGRRSVQLRRGRVVCSIQSDPVSHASAVVVDLCNTHAMASGERERRRRPHQETVQHGGDGDLASPRSAAPHAPQLFGEQPEQSTPTRTAWLGVLTEWPALAKFTQLTALSQSWAGVRLVKGVVHWSWFVGDGHTCPHVSMGEKQGYDRQGSGERERGRQTAPSIYGDGKCVWSYESWPPAGSPASSAVRTYLIEAFMCHTHNAAWHTLHNIICGSAGRMGAYLDVVSDQLSCKVACTLAVGARVPRARVTVYDRKDHITIIVGQERLFAAELEAIWRSAAAD
ncbi:hypothetical protein HU200_003967 [Digitaria exilis]|uniref:Uncharacterized protein n=1 Tax=Digitaria exilis TaxID=1010633 RepID=A0A835KXV4_9POAL|nr:hypothetical protein HU200_003967 [Digitaria exilis]